MRLRSFFAVLALSGLSVVACSIDAVDAGEDVESESSELVQFPAAAFVNVPQLTYGQTSGEIEYKRGRWGVIRWNGQAGDEIVATVTATTPDRRARAYLVEKRDTRYVAILSGTNAVDGLVKAKLEKTQEYFIVFREFSRRVATFTVKLERAGALPDGCAGNPLLEQDIVDRTPQAQNPALSATGVFESTIRRCNVATGCANPVVQRNANAPLTMTKRNDGKWIVSTSGISAEHDGTTAELKGTINVRSDDNRNIPVKLEGAATTGCISLAGRDRQEIDAITYYDVEVTFRATTPPVAERIAYPATPPDAECDNQEAIPDEELLARFAPGAATANLGSAYIMEDQQYCHPQTGCRPWTRAANVGRLTATAHVLGRDQIGISFVDASNRRSATFVVEDGTVNVTNDVLGRGNAANTSRVSDTHLLVKETNVFASGTTKARRFVCIPIPPHP